MTQVNELIGSSGFNVQKKFPIIKTQLPALVVGSNCPWELVQIILEHLRIDKAPRLSISIVIWILSSDTICQLKQFITNSEAAMLSTSAPRFPQNHTSGKLELWQSCVS